MRSNPQAAAGRAGSAQAAAGQPGSGQIGPGRAGPGLRPGARPGWRIPAGLVLLGMSWALYWTLTSAWTRPAFFGLWLGYIITADGLVHWRTGTSLIDRGPRRFILVFAYSVPFWWLFEWCNEVLRNWSYVPPVPFSQAGHVLLFSLCFSTVLPALFETAELLRATRPFRRSPGESAAERKVPWAGPVMALGFLSVVLTLLFPHEMFPLVWVFPFLILDPFNSRMGWPSLWTEVAGRRWRSALVIGAAGLVCGFFWEFWNYWTAGVHWVYHIPALVSHARLFQMPLLGYLAYPVFAASAYAFYQTVQHLLERSRGDHLNITGPAAG